MGGPLRRFPLQLGQVRGALRKSIGGAAIMPCATITDGLWATASGILAVRLSLRLPHQDL
jgi:hypothetical protein